MKTKENKEGKGKKRKRSGGKKMEEGKWRRNGSKASITIEI